MATRQWSNSLKLLKENNIQPRYLYSDKYQFRMSIENRHFQTCNDSKHLPPMSSHRVTGECAPPKCRSKSRKQKAKDPEIGEST